jgi:integrase
VNALASLVPDRFQALILLATFAGLRWGEVTALRRRDLDLSARIVRVALVHVESAAGQLSVGPPSPGRVSGRSRSRPRSCRH